ncbi:adenylate/guanylate cyclase domain-containing protein [Pelagibius sp. CAU 1746]|uniref:cyclic nucleotide-binding domain-containing protein n=1 Tax=Pelagibius sp. CAU 1746 TaxID=3140370 RepID=UPI00325B9EE0
MAEQSQLYEVSGLAPDCLEALVSSGLVDDVADPSSLDPRPYRYAEGEYICRRGDPARCLWVIVTGSVAIKEHDRTLFVRRRSEVIGEQHLVGNGYQRIYDIVANESCVEVLVIDREKIESHPEVGVLWKNIAKIISLKLRNASHKTSSLSRQLADDTRILHAYTNEYALSRRLRAGGEHQTAYAVERAIIWFSDIVDFSRHTLNSTPDRIADIVQRFFNAQTLPILRRGGHIDKFIGDGLMAFWMLPGNGGNARSECVEALRAAEEAVKAVAAIKIGTAPLSLRVGLHIGLVLSGDFGSTTRHQFTLIGREVNKAARLEQLHAEDILESPEDLGAIRISREFQEELGSLDRKKYARRLVARAKNIGEMDVFTA